MSFVVCRIDFLESDKSAYDLHRQLSEKNAKISSMEALLEQKGLLLTKLLTENKYVSANTTVELNEETIAMLLAEPSAAASIVDKLEPKPQAEQPNAPQPTLKNQDACFTNEDRLQVAQKLANIENEIIKITQYRLH